MCLPRWFPHNCEVFHAFPCFPRPWSRHRPSVPPRARVHRVWRREDDLKDVFGKFGEVRDVYMPRDYHSKYVRTRLRPARAPVACACAPARAPVSSTVFVCARIMFVCPCPRREPRGFAFIEFLDERDAKDAQEDLDRAMVGGREITVVFAQVGARVCVCGRVCVFERACVCVCRSAARRRRRCVVPLGTGILLSPCLCVCACPLPVVVSPVVCGVCVRLC